MGMGYPRGIQRVRLNRCYRDVFPESGLEENLLRYSEKPRNTTPAYVEKGGERTHFHRKTQA